MKLLYLCVLCVCFLLAMSMVMAVKTNERLQEEVSRLQQQLQTTRQQVDQLTEWKYWEEYPKNPKVRLPIVQRQVWLASGVGFRSDPMGGTEERLHRGVDLATWVGTQVQAVLPGVVVAHWPAPDGFWKGHPVFGGLVIIKHENDTFSLYGHMQQTFVYETQYVDAGDLIGTVGSTGISTGPHLHFEIIADPLIYLESLR